MKNKKILLSSLILLSSISLKGMLKRGDDLHPKKLFHILVSRYFGSNTTTNKIAKIDPQVEFISNKYKNKNLTTGELILLRKILSKQQIKQIEKKTNLEF